jgi:serine protease AprX
LSKLLLLCLCLSVTVGGQSRGLPVIGSLPLVGPLLETLPLLGSLSSDLLSLLVSGDDRPVRAIVRGDATVIQAIAARDRLRVLKVLDGLVVLEAPPSALEALRGVAGIAAISRDVLVTPAMSIANQAMAADQARAGTPGLLLGLLGTPPVDGRGVGVAVIDSGIAAHVALAGKVVASINFVTGESGTNDLFGHGTHIAGIIAGLNLTGPTPLYRGGVAPGAHLVNVRVLGREGVGYTSDVIAGIQWVVANKKRLGIRVINLSLGHPVMEPCVTDPLCLAAESAVASGLVVVASAGNNGKDAEGRLVLGSISTPGNAPGVITVGALNTWNTVRRDDDTITTYSSRGPSRYDMQIKPDVAAPGNKIVSLAAYRSHLAAAYPSQHVAGSGNNGYAVMSGTSMAAAMVSGGAALLLESAPTMTARHVKVALQMTASPMHREGLVAAGTGSVNLHAARRLGNNALGLLGALPLTTIGGRTISGSGLAFLGPGARLDQASGGAGLRVLGLIDARRSLLKLAFPSRLLPTAPSQVIWGDTSRWTADQQVIWGDQLFNPGGQQVIWGDQIFNPSGQQVIWGDQLFNPSGQQVIWGDQDLSGGNQVIWGDTARTPER